MQDTASTFRNFERMTRRKGMLNMSLQETWSAQNVALSVTVQTRSARSTRKLLNPGQSSLKRMTAMPLQATTRLQSKGHDHGDVDFFCVVFMLH